MQEPHKGQNIDLGWYLIKDLKMPEEGEEKENVLIRCCGVVLKSQASPQFCQLIIHDFTGSIQATLYAPYDIYKNTQPKFGDSVILIGSIVEKKLRHRHLLKLKIERYKIITAEQELKKMPIIIQATRKRLQFQKTSLLKQRKNLNKKINFGLSPQIRSLILQVIYRFFQSNKDISNYKFSCSVIISNHFFKNYFGHDNLEPEKPQLFQCVKLNILNLFRINQLFFLDGIQLRPAKQNNTIEDFYKIDLSVFKKIEQLIFKHSNSSEITTAGMITRKIHEQLRILEDKNYLFNSKLVQAIIENGKEKVYK